MLSWISNRVYAYTYTKQIPNGKFRLRISHINSVYIIASKDFMFKKLTHCNNVSKHRKASISWKHWKWASKAQGLKINFVVANPESNKIRYLFLEYDVLALPIFHHAQGLKRTDYIVGVDGQFLTHVWNSKFKITLTDC